MIIIGLTGSIGMGKSSVAVMFERLGVKSHDSDAAVHRLMQPGQPGYQAIIEAFPPHQYPQIYKREKFFSFQKILDRRALGRLVFNSKEHKEILENILHPLVRQDQNNFIAKMRRFRQNCVLLDIPLLFETDSWKFVNYSVVVSAPFAVQRQRVLDRPGMDEARFFRILEAQMPDAEKRILADYVIETGLGRGRTMGDVKAVLQDIKQQEKQRNTINNEFKHQKSRRF